MTLSIIIISYKTKELLKNCLKSIYDSKIDFPFEIIVVDNHSDDGSKEMINREFKEVRLIINEENIGYGKANNQGMRQAKGKYLLLLNSDTEIIDNAISKIIKILDKKPEIGVVGCKLLNKNNSIQQSAGYLPRLSKVFFWQFFIDDLPLIKKIIKPYQIPDKDFYLKDHEVGWVTGAFFLLRKEIFDKTGGFDEKIFMYTEEVEWCLRIYQAGWKVMYTSEAEIYHIKSASPREISDNSILSEYKGIKYLFKKHKPAWELPVLKIILKMGSMLRLIIFSIIGDKERAIIYASAFKLV